MAYYAVSVPASVPSATKWPYEVAYEVTMVSGYTLAVLFAVAADPLQALSAPVLRAALRAPCRARVRCAADSEVDVRQRNSNPQPFELAQAPSAPSEKLLNTQVVVIGAGIGGLSAAACMAHCGLKVLVCESHDSAGGAAHEWEVKGFHFESGPSLYAGLSPAAGPNPLKHVFQIIGEEPDWITYDRWGTYLP